MSCMGYASSVCKVARIQTQRGDLRRPKADAQQGGAARLDSYMLPHIRQGLLRLSQCEFPRPQDASSAR